VEQALKNVPQIGQKTIASLFLIFVMFSSSACGASSEVSAPASAEPPTSTEIPTETPTPMPASAEPPTSTEIPTETPTPTLGPVALTASCVNEAGHIYCIGEGMPVVTGAPDLYGQRISFSPEFFCASDLDIRLCKAATEAFLLAAKEWGNYGPVEYWIMGVDEAAGDSMVDVFCNRRSERNDDDFNECVKHEGTFGDHGMNSYRELGAQWLEEKSAAGTMGHNGGRHFNYHKYTSSVPWGFDNSYDLEDQQSAAGEQKTVFHEYFHTIQHSALVTQDWYERDEGMKPRWFTEGGAEFMAQVATARLRSSDAFTSSEIAGQGPFDFNQEMQNALFAAKESFKSCGGDLSDTGYGAKCDSYGAAYAGGAWAHAYLSHTYGSDVLLEVFYPNREAMGFEGAFMHTYGQTVEDFVTEFNEFLKLPLDQQMEILPQA
jgi:hypothetical protein